MSNTHVKNIKLGACKVSFGGVDLGYTKGGVQVEVATETLKVTVDQLGQTTISELVQGRNITITAPLAESVLQNMVDLMPGSTLSEEDNSVTITSAQGVNLIDVAKELVLTPQDTTDYVLTIPKAATAGIGLAQIADVMPQVSAAMDKAQGNISSGDTVRIIFGVATILVAAFIAWSQVRKHQNGMV
ncbi:hypothetical protein HZ58_003861 [Escherichia coli]|nr:hypothetical protein [Escherichia coli]